MSAWKKLLAVGLASTVLAACGGGGGSNGDDGFAAPSPGTMRYDIVGGVTSLPTNRSGIPPESNSPYWVQLNVRVQRANGTPVADGTTINIRTSNVRSAVLSIIDDPATTDVNEFATFIGTVFAKTTGGQATFFIHSATDPGSVVFTASAADPEIPNRTLSLDVPMTITQGPEPFERITIEPQRTVLPANVFGISPFWGSPFISETTVTRRIISAR